MANAIGYVCLDCRMWIPSLSHRAPTCVHLHVALPEHMAAADVREAIWTYDQRNIDDPCPRCSGDFWKVKPDPRYGPGFQFAFCGLCGYVASDYIRRMDIVHGTSTG